MAFCPECRVEYPAAIVACRDCGCALIEGSPPSTEPTRVHLVILTPVSGVVEGSMLSGALESQGLHPRVSSHALPAHGLVLRDWSTLDWGEIRVPEEELDEARLVLSDFREAVERMPPLEPDEDVAGGDELSPRPEESDGEEDTGELDPPTRLTAVQGTGIEGERRPDAPRGDPGPVSLAVLCLVGDVAEGVMITAALRNQGLHPIFAESSAGIANLGAEAKRGGEIRLPPEEILEARLVLQDFRHGAPRSRESEPEPGRARDSGPDSGRGSGRGSAHDSGRDSPPSDP